MNEVFRAIRKRYSSRNFEPYLFSLKEKKLMEKIIKATPVLDPKIKLAWIYEDNSPIGSGRIYEIMKKQTHKKLTEYGFQGEAIILSLTQNDHATCWMVSGKAVVENAPAVIVLGKGTKAGILSSAKRFFIGSDSRKGRETILTKESLHPTSEQDQIIDAMRLAPSALNRQPWQFTILDKQTIQINKLSGHKIWSYLDLGIVLYHGYAAGKSLKKKLNIVRKTDETYLLKW